MIFFKEIAHREVQVTDSGQDEMISMGSFSFLNHKGEVSECTGNNVTLTECNKDTVKVLL